MELHRVRLRQESVHVLDFIRKLKVKGEHIAMIPNRDWLIVTGSRDDEGLGIYVVHRVFGSIRGGGP